MTASRALAVGLLLVGCRPPEDVEPLACRNPKAGVAELGLGDLDRGFVPAQDGAAAPIRLGPQGMHMVVLSVAVDDLERPPPGGLGTRIAVGLEVEGELIGGTTVDMDAPTAEGRAEFLGLRAIITEAEVEALNGQTVVVEAGVEDGCGRLIETSAAWILAI